MPEHANETDHFPNLSFAEFVPVILHESKKTLAGEPNPLARNDISGQHALSV